MKKRVKFISFFFVLIFLLSACGNEEERQRVTWLRVDFTINLNSLDSELTGPFKYKIYKKGSLINQAEYLESPGVIVFNNADPLDQGIPLVAFDLRCPYENSMNILVIPDDNQVVCPNCETKYDLTFGNAIGGPSKTRLQTYCISNSGAGRYRIYNCR